MNVKLLKKHYSSLNLLMHFFFFKVPIPRFAVGIVIGRNGEMIKKIQNDAGVRIQFKPGTLLRRTRINMSLFALIFKQNM